MLLAATFSCSDSLKQGLPDMPAVVAEDFPASARAAAEERLEAARSNPDDSQVNGELGMLLHAHKLFESASVCYRRAAALSDGEFQWVYLLGVVEQESGSYDRAAEAFRRSLAKRAYVPAAIRLGEALASLERYQEARETLEDALQMDRNQPAAYYALGRTLIDLGETEDVKALLRRATELSPESGAAYYALGLAYRDGGDQASAQRYLGLAETYSQTKPPIDDPTLAAVKKLSANEHYFLNLGQSLEGRGKFAEAVDAYQSALDIDPTIVRAHVNLVAAYGRLGQLDKAEAHYIAANKINSQLEELHNNWGVVEAMRENPAAAADAFRMALSVNPQSAEAHANLGVALMQLGETGSAVEHLKTALMNDPTHRSALLHLGGYELEAGHTAGAIDYLERAVQGPQDSRLPFVLYALANAYRLHGEPGRAIELARQALSAAESFGIIELAAQIRRETQSLESGILQ